MRRFDFESGTSLIGAQRAGIRGTFPWTEPHVVVARRDRSVIIEPLSYCAAEAFIPRDVYGRAAVGRKNCHRWTPGAEALLARLGMIRVIVSVAPSRRGRRLQSSRAVQRCARLSSTSRTAAGVDTMPPSTEAVRSGRSSKSTRVPEFTSTRAVGLSALLLIGCWKTHCEIIHRQPAAER